MAENSILLQLLKLFRQSLHFHLLFQFLEAQKKNTNQEDKHILFLLQTFHQKTSSEKFYKNVGQCRNKFGIIKTSKEIITLEKKKGESL